MTPAPFPCPEEAVRPEWIDDNGHMNLAHYVVIFDHATDAIFAALGIGPAYKLAHDYGTFGVEADPSRARCPSSKASN